MSAIYDIAKGIAEGAADAILERGPQFQALFTSIYKAMTTSTIEDAPPPPTPVVNALEAEIANARNTQK